jgi:hypothetical protein
MYWQTIQGELNEQGVPQNLTIIRTMSKQVENTCALGKSAPSEPNDPSANDFVRYDVTGTDAHGNLYFLSLPKDVLKPGAFTAILDTEFGAGRNGHWRANFNCTKP